MPVTIKSYRKEREKEILDNLSKAMDKVGGIVEKEGAQNIYKHAASTPWKHTGILENAITHNVLSGEIAVEIGVKEGQHLNGESLPKIGKYLELGTSRMPPYPWLYPAVEAKRSEIIEILKGKFTIEGV